MDVKELLTCDKSLAFVAYAHKVVGINFYSQAYSNLLGFTIDGDKLQFKNYYELKEIPSDSVLAEYFPEIESFKMMSQFQDKTVKFSLVVGNKTDGVKETQYFHVKFGGLTKFVIMPKPPALISILQVRNPNAGMSYEYTDGILNKKYYLYIENPNDMAKVLKLKGINADVEKLEHLECYYTDGGDFKVNLIYFRPPEDYSGLVTLDDASRITHERVAKFLLDHRKSVWYIGVTKSRKFSVYFTATDDKDFIESLCESSS